MALGWIVAVIVLLLATLWWNVPVVLIKYYRTCRALRNIPHRPYHWSWIWGNAHQEGRTALFEYTEFMKKGRYKVTLRWLGPFWPMVVVEHYEPLRKVVKQPKDTFVYQYLLSPWLGDGLLISRGEKWHRNRRLITPAFHFEILKSYVKVYNSCLETLLQKWSMATSRNKPVKLFETISLMSLDILLQCAFSNKSNCQVKTEHPYINAVTEMSELIVKRFGNPLYLIDWLYFLTPNGRRMKKVCWIVHEYADKVIKERQRSLGLAANGKVIDRETLIQNVARQGKYLDFLDILLTARDEEGNGLTDLEIRDEVDTFMFEGHDTTTSGMCWTLYCLAKYPEHQQKVREEVRSVLMGREQLEYDDLKELQYTQWCIKEAMRLYPPVYHVSRVASEDLELDGHLIPKGTSIGIRIYSLHHHPDIWENPEVFDPLRFHPANADGRDPFAYFPFSAGSRNCIGQNFALNEERIVVATIVNMFSLSLVEDHKVEICDEVIIRARNDIKLSLEPL